MGWFANKLLVGRTWPLLKQVEMEISDLSLSDRAKVVVAAADFGLWSRDQPGGAVISIGLRNPIHLSAEDGSALFRMVEDMMTLGEKRIQGVKNSPGARTRPDSVPELQHHLKLEVISFRLILARIVPSFDSKHAGRVVDLGHLLQEASGHIDGAVAAKKIVAGLLGNPKDPRYYEELALYAKNIPTEMIAGL